MDASLYYTDITPDVDLLLQNVTLTVDRPKSNDATTASSKTEIASSSSSIKKSVTFEDTDVFALHNINLSVQKVRKHFMTFLSNVNQIFFCTGTINWYYGPSWKWKIFTSTRYLSRNYENERNNSG